MSTLKEFYEQSFVNCIKVEKYCAYSFNKMKSNILQYTLMDFYSGTLFFSFYFENSNVGLGLFKKFIIDLNDNYKKLFELNPNPKLILPKSRFFDGKIKVNNNGNSVDIHVTFVGDKSIGVSDLISSRRLFFYVDKRFTDREISELKSLSNSVNFSLVIRGKEYKEYMDINSKPMAFISHDSRDKANIAKPLADRLIQMTCRVWYDEYSLKVGDKLRESIEDGLKKCSKCILILTPNFINNTGWTKKEFNSIFSREIIEDKNLVLPIWAGVSKVEVYEYCPSLLNVVGLHFDDLGEEAVALKLYSVIMNES